MKTQPVRSFLTFSSLLVALTAASLGGCASIAVATAPSKKAVTDQSTAAKEADSAFWSTLHGGRYEEIGPTLEKLEAAYLEHPEDPRTAAHIGFLHIWRIGERARHEPVVATVTDDMLLSRRYFEEAVSLDPNDSRFRGFLASTTMAEGSIHHDEKLTREGFFAMKDAVSAWPEFNLFTRGYTMSRLPEGDERYAAALEDQWVTLDLCTEDKLDRKNPDYAPYMRLETREGKKRACWNSWIAPHNFEGFFLNMGDMIVKSGDPTVARKVYAQAKLAKEFAQWPYRDVLDRRIAQADENVPLFRAKPAGDPERRLMIESSFSCMGCHQQLGRDDVRPIGRFNNFLVLREPPRM